MRMQLISLMSVVALAIGQAAAANDEIVGQFDGSLKANSKVLNITLDCRSKTECVTTWNGSETRMNGVKPFAKFDIATTALECARRRDLSQINNPEILAEQSAVAPLLASGGTFDMCWDLNSPTPTYTLACVADRTPFRASSLYLLVANPWGRGVGQCGYMIFTLKRNG